MQLQFTLICFLGCHLAITVHYSIESCTLGSNWCYGTSQPLTKYKHGVFRLVNYFIGPKLPFLSQQTISIEAVWELCYASFDIIMSIKDEIDDLGKECKLIEKWLRE